MKYIALLRGINVGGKNKVSMNDLKLCFENAGFKNVVTYINSGNVIFDSEEQSLTDHLIIAGIFMEKLWFSIRLGIDWCSDAKRGTRACAKLVGRRPKLKT